MKRKPSINALVTRALTAMMCTTVALAALVTYGVYRKMEEAMLNKIVQTESHRLVTRLSRFGASLQAPMERDMGPSMFAWGESSRFPATSMPAELRDLPLGLHMVPKETGQWHVNVSELMDGRLYVMYDAIVLEQQARQFALALAAIVVVFSLLAVLVSRIVARWITQPLNTLTERLSRWAPGQPQQGVELEHEADRLMEAFNRVQAQVDARFADQREFSANLHHEIRTPLTVIRSDAELMLRLQQATGDARVLERLRRIVASVEEVTQSLESTYLLAHADTGGVEMVALHTCVEDIVAGLQWEAHTHGLLIHNAVRVDHQSLLARNALMTVVRNIIRNAIVHAAPATLEIASTPTGLDFLDSGPGIAPNEKAHLFERYFTTRRRDVGGHPDGVETLTPCNPGWDATGLGLAIAKRVCDIQGWRLEVISPIANQRGTQFRVVFSEADDALRAGS